jgi:hypothetical protein
MKVGMLDWGVGLGGLASGGSMCMYIYISPRGRLFLYTSIYFDSTAYVIEIRVQEKITLYV